MLAITILNNQYGPIGCGNKVGSVGDFSPGIVCVGGSVGGLGGRGSTSSPIVMSAQERNSSCGPQPTAPVTGIAMLHSLLRNWSTYKAQLVLTRGLQVHT